MRRGKRVLFPEPQVMEEGEGRVLLGSRGKNGCILVMPEGGDALQLRAAEVIREAIAACTGGAEPETFYGVAVSDEGKKGRVLVSLSKLPHELPLGDGVINEDEAYTIEVGEKGISLKAKSSAGLFYAAQTFRQLLETEGDALYFPVVRIVDWPQFKYRGLFVESKWGPDRMNLDDWKEAIDFIASLKMNFMGIGIYGCWCIQYDMKITEFLTVPIKKYPQLSTPKTIKYYSPMKGDVEVVDYLPTMFEEDLFGEVIAYGKERNVIVRPQFNSLGHNTLIPRTFPEISAKDEEGRPTNYGFCISNPRTYEILFDIYDEIIDRYLLPNGVDYFHLGMDEVYPVVGIDPAHPQKAVDPWCKCPECSKHSREDLLVEFLLKITTHVKEKGINNITLWNDQLARHMNILGEELIAKFKEKGLFDKLILDWWWYNPKVPETIRPELGLRTFVCPMAGYYFWMNYQSYLLNIYRMLKLGYEQGSEGTEAYCTFDYSFHRNYFCLAEYSWNQKQTGELEGFRDKYIQGLFGADVEKAREAFTHFDRVVEPDGLGGIVNNLLVYYRYSYVDRQKDYPRDYPGEAFTKIHEDMEGIRTRLEACLGEIVKAREGFLELKDLKSSEPRLIDHYLVECERYETVIRAYLRLLALEKRYEELRKEPVAIGGLLDEMCSEVKEILKAQDELMGHVESIKSHYLLPHTMRELTMFRDFLAALVRALDEVAGKVKRGELEPAQLPQLDLRNTRELLKG